jgi:hypothetical protein
MKVENRLIEIKFKREKTESFG